MSLLEVSSSTSGIDSMFSWGGKKTGTNLLDGKMASIARFNLRKLATCGY